MKGGFVLLNGKFHPETEPLFAGVECNILNTAVKESFRAENNEILFPVENYFNILDHLASFQIPVPAEWDLPRLKKDVSRLLNKNHLFLAARVNLFFLKGKESTGILFTAEEIPRGFYPLNETGILMDFFDEGFKCDSPYNNFESSSRYLWISAKISAKNSGKQNLLISNSYKYICEGIGVSFGFWIQNTLILPSFESRGYYPPLVKIIGKAAKEKGIEVCMRSSVTKDDLLEADEVFLIDNCLGIQKVLGLQNRRYYSTKTVLLSSFLREQAETVFQIRN
jgi:branched-subunit amino acid aminotransferase/4-amino-4-deoxychorismate lyase